MKARKTAKPAENGPTAAPAKPSSLHLALTVGLLIIVVIESLLLLQAYLPATLPQSPVRVLLVGQPSGALQTLLESEDFRLEDIRMIKTADQSQVRPEDYSDADVVIFQGQEHCPQALDSFVGYLEKNPPALWRPTPNQLFFGNACSRIPGSNLTGWKALLQEKTGPADIAQYYSLGQGPLPQLERGYLIVTTEHRIFNGIKNDYVNRPVLYRTYPTWTLAQVTLQRPDNTQYLDGNFSQGNIIALQEGGFGGTALYVGFEPAYDSQSIGSRNLVLNSLLYLANRA
ncbi:hypothetical protein HYV43_06785 [Candidatus Micrarchaeota archaeon]|nr:hypothetical protein [Candidatus Micrarchaeota archaeon]